MSFGIQIVVPYGIMQIVYSLGELHGSLRRHVTDRYPFVKVSVPSNENHRFVLLVNKQKIGYLTADADSYGELELYTSDVLHERLKSHHESKGLSVIEMGEIDLVEWVDGDFNPNSFICDSFEHNPLKKNDGDEHMHVCKNILNDSKRCGYNSIVDSNKCKLYTSFLKITTVTNVKEVTKDGSEKENK